MKFSELLMAAGLSADAALPLDSEITGIACDSRKVVPGSVFVCLQGALTDGHEYALKAVEAGAVLVIAERDVKAPCQWIVSDTHALWVSLCEGWFGHPAESLRLIGVTGTNGKTTTTYMIKTLLEFCGYKVGLIGTIQNMVRDTVLPSHNTTPGVYELQELFAAMREAGCDTAVMEVSSHALEQGRVDGCFFDVAVFTNLTQDHLDYHGTMECYLEAKKKLFYRCKTGVINVDDVWADALREGLECPLVTYSAQDNKALYTAHGIRQRPRGVDFELVGNAGEIGRVKLQIPGLFSVYNALAAAGCALAMGIPFETVLRALSEVKGVKGRAEVVPTGRDYTVVIDYAHTPDGLENICKTLAACKEGRLITVFGCGGDRDKTKRPKMGRIAADLSDVVVVTSDNPRSEDPQAIIEDVLEGMKHSKTPCKVEPDRSAAVRWALQNARTGDTVLLAGKGHETYQVLKEGTIHLDEREIVAQVLAEEE